MKSIVIIFSIILYIFGGSIECRLTKPRHETNLLASYWFDEGQGISKPTFAIDEKSSLLGNINLGNNVEWIEESIGIDFKGNLGQIITNTISVGNLDDLAVSPEWSIEIWYKGTETDAPCEPIIWPNITRTPEIGKAYCATSDASTGFGLVSSTEIFADVTLKCETHANRITGVQNAIQHVVIAQESNGDGMFARRAPGDELPLLITYSNFGIAGKLGLGDMFLYSGEQNTDYVRFSGKIFYVGIHGEAMSNTNAKNNFEAGMKNSAPVSKNQVFDAVEDVASGLNFSRCTSDFDEDSLSIIIRTLPTAGKLYICTGAFVAETTTAGCTVVVADDTEYSLDTEFVVYIADVEHTYGPTFDTFTFASNDGDRVSLNAVATIDVVAVNDAPVALADTIKVKAGVSTEITLTSSDPDNGDSISKSRIISGPAKGTLYWLNGTEITTFPATIPGGSTLSYTSNDPISIGGTSGLRSITTDEFVFKVADSEDLESNQATLLLDLLNPVDCFVDTVIVGTEDERIAIDLHTYCNDARTNDPADVTFHITKLPLKGLLYHGGGNQSITTLDNTGEVEQQISYQPNSEEYGNSFDEFEMYVETLTGFQSARTTIMITINPRNDLPEVSFKPDKNFEIVGGKEKDMEILFSDTDEDPNGQYEVKLTVTGDSCFKLPKVTEQHRQKYNFDKHLKTDIDGNILIPNELRCIYSTVPITANYSDIVPILSQIIFKGEQVVNASTGSFRITVDDFTGKGLVVKSMSFKVVPNTFVEPLELWFVILAWSLPPIFVLSCGWLCCFRKAKRKQFRKWKRKRQRRSKRRTKRKEFCAEHPDEEVPKDLCSSESEQSSAMSEDSDKPTKDDKAEDVQL